MCRKPKPCSDDPDTESRDQNIVSVLRFEVRSIATEVEMATLPPRHCSHPRESKVIDGKINRPRNQLVTDQRKKSNNWGIFNEIPVCEEDLRHTSCSGSYVDILGVRNESYVSLEIVCCFVVLGVGEAPGVVRNEQERVDSESDSVVHVSGFGEGAVAGFVGEFPEAC